MPEAAVLGVGIDAEERNALRHLDDAALRRAADRWLTPAERAWCAAQGSLEESLVVVLCCKEAAFKAWKGPRVVHQVSLALEGSAAAGRARAEGAEVAIQVEWRQAAGHIVALALAVGNDSRPA